MISVFICTYKPNEQILKRTVDAIINQDLAPLKWEFAVIDNNSPSPVADIDYIKRQKIAVFVEKEQGLASARRCAMQNAKGDILVFVDDDNILESNYLTEVEKTFSDGSIGAISGSIYPEYIVEPEKWFYAFEHMVAIRRFEGDKIILNELSVHNDLFPIGAGMAIRQSLLEDYYKDEITLNFFIDGRKGNALSSCEDLDLDLYVLYRKKKIGVNPLMKLIHIIPESRTKMDYINKLAAASLRSSALVNKKWKPVFKHHVFDWFEIGLIKAILGMSFNGILSFNRERLVKYKFFKELIKTRFL